MVQIRQFQSFFRISFRILELKRNLGGGGRRPNITFFAHFHSGSLCQSIVLEAKPLIGDLKTALEGYHWLTRLTPLLIGQIQKTAFFCCSCTFKMKLRCQEKETGQVKSRCPKKPFESKKLIVDVIIYVQQKGGDLKYEKSHIFSNFSSFIVTSTTSDQFFATICIILVNSVSSYQQKY